MWIYILIVLALIVLVRMQMEKYTDDFAKEPTPHKPSELATPVINAEEQYAQDKKEYTPITLDIKHPEDWEEIGDYHILAAINNTADDKIFDASVASGYKNKRALEIRSHWNSDHTQWKKYYDSEFNDHESRRWWEDNDYELAKKHVIF